jgi:integrase
MDVPGQEERAYMREKICPTSGPGLLTASARKLRAKQIIEASGADKPETLQASLASVSGTTFRQQAEKWLAQHRKKGTAPSTMGTWECCVENWLNPFIGDLPLSSIKKTVAQTVIDRMVGGGLSASSVNSYFAVVKMVLAFPTNEDGDELYPRNWKRMQLVIPEIVGKKLRRPCFNVQVMNGIVAGSHGQLQMLYILCGASGLRIGEALGIKVEKVTDGGKRIIIDGKAWRSIEQDFLKTPNGDREIDFPDSVAKLLVQFIGERKTGLLFRTRRGKPLSQSNILRRSLHLILAKLNQPQAGAHAFRRFRQTHLRMNLVGRDLEHFWMGHSDTEIGDRYSMVRTDGEYRRDVVARIGVGFDVPAHLNLMNLKIEQTVEEKVTVTA